MKDFYYILGVDVNCSLNEIKEAYRKLSKKFHPDVNQGDAYFDSRFREINEAYETLGDPVKRNLYDIESEKFKLSQHSAAFHRANKRPRYYAKASHFDMSKRKGPGIAMMVTFIVVALICIVYIVQSFTGNKKPPVTKVAAVAAMPVVIRHHHKRHFHYHLKNKAIADFAKLKIDSTRIKPVASLPLAVKKTLPVENTKPLAVAAKPVLPVVTKKPAPVISNKPLPVIAVNNNGELYTTTVKPNVTGMVNMRQFDDFNSVIIKTIPANSKVSVLEKGDVYYKVSYDSAIGYVPKWSLLSK